MAGVTEESIGSAFAGTARGNMITELVGLEKALRAQGDAGLAEKAASLAAKGRRDDVFFAFCGHFSAGKSSLINRLCGAKLLPSPWAPPVATLTRSVRLACRLTCPAYSVQAQR